MSFFDLRQMDENSLIETDLCIVGSGPSGLSIAKEFEGSNIEVLVLESGGLDKEADTQSLYDIENTGAPFISTRRVRGCAFMVGLRMSGPGVVPPLMTLISSSVPGLPTRDGLSRGRR